MSVFVRPLTSEQVGTLPTLLGCIRMRLLLDGRWLATVEADGGGMAVAAALGATRDDAATGLVAAVLDSMGRAC